MKLGIIAAGDGQRLTEEGIKKPKPLIKVFEKTLLERVLDISKKYNFESCNIIINKKFEKEVVNSGILKKYKDVKINSVYKSTPSSLHTLNALIPFLTDSPFCLMTIDSIFKNEEFDMFIREANEIDNYDGLIAVTDFVDDEKPLWVKLDKDNKIISFSSTKGGSEYVTGGIYFFKKGIIENTDKAISENMSRLRNFLQYLIEIGVTLKAVKFSKIIDIDHINDLAEAEKFLQQQ